VLSEAEEVEVVLSAGAAAEEEDSWTIVGSAGGAEDAEAADSWTMVEEEASVAIEEGST
jgi:hypothetical protein